MLRNIILLAFWGSFLLATNLYSLDQATFQELNFKVGHSGNSEVKKAFQLLLDHGILTQEKQQRILPKTTVSSPGNEDCRVSFKQGLLQSGLLKDLSEKRLPKEVLEIGLSLEESYLLIKGRLDGPIFINPRFEARVNVVFVKANMFSVRISSLRVAGFKVTIFSNLAAGYILDAMKRAFPSSNQAKCYKGPVGADGTIVINMTINPEGFVSGIGTRAYLSNIGIDQGEFWFSFTTPRR